MSVIALPNLPPQGGGASIDWELRSIAARFASPLSGASRTLERPGSAWAATLRFENLSTSRRALMESFLYSLRGYAQRFYLPDYSRLTLRGAFVAPELFSNNHFASGTTGWTPTTGISGSVADGVFRALLTRVDGSNQAMAIEQAVTATQYAPHALRALYQPGLGTLTKRLVSGSASFTGDYGIGSDFATNILDSLAFVPRGTTVYGGVQSRTVSGVLAGSYFELPYLSLARCALVDNGPNLLTRSDEIDHATWTKSGVSIGGNAAVAPDGTTTADEVDENGANSEHLIYEAVTVSSAVGDYAFSIALQATGRAWVALRIFETTGSHSASAYFNISTGTLGTVSSTANVANARASITALGNGWFLCSLVARKTNAATTLRAVVNSTTADGASLTFAGSSANAFYAWRGTLSASAVASRLQQTVASGSSGTSQTGSALYLKGLPASTAGLLVAGDVFEVITSVGSEFKRATAALNSDAGGLGYLQFEPSLRNAPADGAAVIVQRPLCRMMLDANSVRWTEKHLGFCDLEFTAVEDLAA